MLTIRRFDNRDADAVVALHRHALQTAGGLIDNPVWDSDLLDIGGIYFANGGEFLVGLVESEIVAMGALRRKDTRTAEIKRMRVHPSHQRHGYGRQILAVLEKRAVEIGYKDLILDTGTRQIAAQQFYAAHGYVETGRRQVLPDFEIILYRKSLDGP